MTEPVRHSPPGVQALADVVGAFMHQSPPVTVEPRVTVAQYDLVLSPRAAHDLYNEIYWLLDREGVRNVGDRDKLDLPVIYRLYDTLFTSGVDGTGGTTT